MSSSAQPPVIATSSILFSPQSTDFSRTLSSLKRASLSIKNRLQSITVDAAFVAQVSQAYGLPLVANERCGSWYIPPASKIGSVYFKSTDGHMHQWGFSLRRLNTILFDVLLQYGGCIIVDSTRRGKAMPDALMKTVPIWCAVFNRYLFTGSSSPSSSSSRPDDIAYDHGEFHQLFTPPSCVSASEHAQIDARINGFIRDLETLNLDVKALREKVQKPVRPIWVTRDSKLPDEAMEFEDFYPIVLCTASRRVHGGEVSEGGYIQGAGDDSEAWACGLTPPIFWKHKDRLLSATEDELPDLIADLLVCENMVVQRSAPIFILPTSWLAVGDITCLDSESLAHFGAVITIGQKITSSSSGLKAKKHLHLQCRDKKLGSRDLRTQLPLVQALLATTNLDTTNILVCCSDAKDLSIGVALAILCLHPDSNGQFERSTTGKPDKTLIKQRLSWIMTSHPSASPSRTTLQSVNDFLLTNYRNTPSIRSLQAKSAPAKVPAVTDLFVSLEGKWSFERIITNHRATGLAGSISGMTTFIAREPTCHDSKLEYLYDEDGVFTTTNPGVQMDISRRWIWRLSGSKTTEDDAATEGRMSQSLEGISIHFVKPDGQTEDYLYNDLGSPTANNDYNESNSTHYACKAHAEHPCGEDLYISDYTFWMNDKKVDRFEIEHKVRGPTKDYVSRTEHTRWMSRQDS